LSPSSLPLCLGIAIASGFPAICGLFTAIVGGLLSTWLGSAPLTIKGPSAGLIVIALGAVTELGQGEPTAGYRPALACIVAAAAIQVMLALLKVGKLGDFFPSAVVHGMLAAIGLILISKQVHSLVGVVPSAKEPLHLLMEIPHSLETMDRSVALIGAISLTILFGHSVLATRLTQLKKIPAPLLVLVLAAPLGSELPPEFLVDLQLPSELKGSPTALLSVVSSPDFSVLLSPTSLKFTAMFALVGSIESLLSAKAIDLLDPSRRKSDLNKDLRAVGVGNVVAGLLGGLPMISEIARSSANIGYGARSRLSNFAHGVFLFLFAAFLPGLIERIPSTALAAMLLVTGLRLASPREFSRAWHIGTEHFAAFLATMCVCFATDLLVGVAAGLALVALLNMLQGATLRTLFRPVIDETVHADGVTLCVRESATFLNFLALRSRILGHADASIVRVDLSGCRIVDHSVMEKLQELADDMVSSGRRLELSGLEKHVPASDHPLAARRWWQVPS
jgi:MFS superfamily sulfate permease-like transporter